MILKNSTTCFYFLRDVSSLELEHRMNTVLSSFSKDATACKTDKTLLYKEVERVFKVQLFKGLFFSDGTNDMVKQCQYKVYTPKYSPRHRIVCKKQFKAKTPLKPTHSSNLSSSQRQCGCYNKGLLPSSFRPIQPLNTQPHSLPKPKVVSRFNGREGNRSGIKLTRNKFYQTTQKYILNLKTN